MSESEKSSWSFELGIQGPFLIQGRWPLEEVHELLPDEVVFEEIEVRASPHGAQLGCKVLAESGFAAQQIALYFIEQTLDVLSTQTNLALKVSRQESKPFSQSKFGVKRSMDRHDWQSAFRETHHLRLRAPAFLQALGCYRRALLSESPVERYSLLFQAILWICHGHPQGAEVGDIHRHFARLWGEQERWPHLRERAGGLGAFFELYASCSQNPSTLMPQNIVDILEKLEALHRVTHAFLTSWRNQEIELPGEFYHTSLHIETGWGHILQ